MGVCFDILARHPHVRAVITNTDMGHRDLLDRERTRISGVPIDGSGETPERSDLRERMAESLVRLEHTARRICFAPMGTTLDQVARIARDWDAKLVVVDWIQRINVDWASRDPQSLSARKMEILRGLADDGFAVVAVAAVSRGHDVKGRSTYEGVGFSMASIRDSSEFEYGADDVWTLSAIGDDGACRLLLAKHKARYGEKMKCEVVFAPTVQRFDLVRTRPPCESADKE
jgi:replicative DNA helicase